jgi:hypothetical protein
VGKTRELRSGKWEVGGGNAEVGGGVRRRMWEGPEAGDRAQEEKKKKHTGGDHLRDRIHVQQQTRLTPIATPRDVRKVTHVLPEVRIFLGILEIQIPTDSFVLAGGHKTLAS